MIRVDIRAKRFGETPVLGPIRFEVTAGETVALVGPSGIGKSTLLRIVAGFDSAFDGDVERPGALAFVFQEPTLLPWRSARDNLVLIHEGLSNDQADAALQSVGLAGKADLFPGQLSLGQQRRLSLARAFAGNPDLLIMDEPFASLDERTGKAMLALTLDLIARHRPATLFVTHVPEEARRLGARVLSMEAGPEGAVLKRFGLNLSRGGFP